MSRWFRFYDDALNDPKVQRLTGEMFKSWVNILCIASKNDGVLPCLADVAYMLRMDEAALSELLNELCERGLIDPVEVEGAPMSYEPHNWGERQFILDNSDPTAPTRMRAYRRRQKEKRNATVTQDRNATVTVTAELRPDTDTDTDTEQNNSVANATGAEAPPDPSEPEREFFKRGKEILGKSSGGQLAKLLNACGKNVSLARSKLELAATKHEPAPFIAGVIRAGPVPTAKPLTAHQQERNIGREILNDIDRFVSSSGGQADSELLRHDTGDGPEGVRGGVRGAIIDLSATCDQESGGPGAGTGNARQLSQLSKIPRAS